MKIKDVCTINDDQLDSKEKREKPKFSYLDLANITENQINTIGCFKNDELPSRAKRKVLRNDIVVSTVRPIQKHHGILQQVEQPLLVSTAFAVLRPDESLVDPYYLYYFLASHKCQRKMELIANTSVSSYPSLRPEDIGNLPFEKKESSYQKNVGNSLRFIDKKINSNLKMSKKMEEYVQVLFHKWFVDFNFPNESGDPYAESGGAMQDVEGRRVPKGWEIAKISDFVKLNQKSTSMSDVLESKIPYFNIPDFDEKGTFIEVDPSNVKSDKYLFSKNNLLVSKLNPRFNRVAYPYKVDKGICSTEFTVWEPTVENHLEFLYALAKTNRFKRHCVLGAGGTSGSHNRVKPEYMLRLTFPYKKEKINKFNNIVQPMIQQISLMKSDISILKETRDILIKKYFD